jgi:hypothetical protein
MILIGEENDWLIAVWKITISISGIDGRGLVLRFKVKPRNFASLCSKENVLL